LQFQLTVNVAAVTIAFLGSCIFQESPFTPIQLLWVNLIMDSLGALALATDNPRPYLLDRPPYGRQVQLLRGILLVNIIGQGVYQIIVLIVILVFGKRIWNDVEFTKADGTADKEVLYTLMFNVFVFCQIFNLPNCRMVARTQHFFDAILSNYLFIGIFIGIAAIQAIIVEVAGVVFHTTGLTWRHWVSTLAIGAFSWILGIFLRLVPIREITHEDVELQRQEMYEKLMKPLRKMSEEEQWELERQDAAEKEEQRLKKRKSSGVIGPLLSRPGSARVSNAETPARDEPSTL
jgi:Ca2+-transporting ATPase